MIEGWNIIIAVVVLAAVIAAVLPFVPLWAGYVFTSAYAYTRFLDILQHGASTKRVVVLATSTMGAVLSGWVLWRKRKGEKS